jgi:hypothetical protein
LTQLAQRGRSFFEIERHAVGRPEALQFVLHLEMLPLFGLPRESRRVGRDAVAFVYFRFRGPHIGIRAEGLSVWTIVWIFIPTPDSGQDGILPLALDVAGQLAVERLAVRPVRPVCNRDPRVRVPRRGARVTAGGLRGSLRLCEGRKEGRKEKMKEERKKGRKESRFIA